MSLIKGDACTVKVTVGATPYELEGYEFTWQNSADEAEATHFGTTAGQKEYDYGNEEWSGTIKGNMRTADIEAYNAMKTPGTELALDLVVDPGVFGITGNAKTVSFSIDRVTRRGDTFTEWTLNYKGRDAYTFGTGGTPPAG